MYNVQAAVGLINISTYPDNQKKNIPFPFLQALLTGLHIIFGKTIGFSGVNNNFIELSQLSSAGRAFHS
jgi:hypothetical protein